MAAALQSILLIDDDEISNFLNKILIKHLGWQVDVYTASNGAEALAVLEQNNIMGSKGFIPCLLILDINMPTMNGWQFLEAFNKRYPQEVKDNLPIVMITVSENERDIIRATNTNLVRDYIQKPLTEERLMEIVENFLESR